METTSSYVGIDLHKACLTMAVRDSSGTIVKTVTFDCKCVNKIKDFISSLPRPVHCAIESVGMYEWLWELLEPICDKVTLVDATELRFRAGSKQAKTDKIDAKFISLLLFKGDLPISFVPDKTTRQFRKICRHWRAVSETMTDIKIRMRWILNQHNLPGPTNITGDSARRWFLGQGHLLDSVSAFTFSQFLTIIESLELQQLAIRRKILEFAHLPQFTEEIVIVKTVAGIGEIIAAIIVSEVAGFNRFPKSGDIACYTGLTERTKESAGRRAEGHISSSGPETLRWALVEAAVTLVRSDPHYRAMHARIFKHTQNKGKTKVAMARKLIVWIWKMVQTKEPFRRFGSTEHNRNANIARLATRANVAEIPA